jgi:S-adenosylmethionine:tRNA ribosyltransferase-isomerase
MNPEFDISSYSYELPPDLIAQVPAQTRDQSRLLVVNSMDNSIRDLNFPDIIDYFQAGDLLVVNDTKVFPARLEGKKQTGGKIELFLLEYPDFNYPEKINPAENDKCKFRLKVTGLLKSSKKPKTGSRIYFSPAIQGRIEQLLDDGKALVQLDISLNSGEKPEDVLMNFGRVPLPPYIQRKDSDHSEDRERYQTLFATKPGAIAAPTAGLHFSDDLLSKLDKKGVNTTPITLHVGYGTFAPVRVNDIRDHKIHEEYVEVSPETADLINRTRQSGNKIWTVGTTSTGLKSSTPLRDYETKYSSLVGITT